MRGKQKGNRYEREIARKLSEWIFGDKDKLWRNSSSGARGYKGDVVPYKPIPWRRWPFLVEVKYGYGKQIPKGLSYPQIVDKWFKKALDELYGEQEFVLLIIKFERCRDILMTNVRYIFRVDPYFIFLPKNCKCHGYVYDFQELLKLPFEKAVSIRRLRVC